MTSTKIILPKWDLTCVDVRSQLDEMNPFSYKQFAFTKWNTPFCRDLTQVKRLIWVGWFFSYKQFLSVHCMRKVFLLCGYKKAMKQFQIVLDMTPKIKPTRHTSEIRYDSIIQACKFIEKTLQHRWFLVINAQFLRTPNFENYQWTLASENLSGAAILNFKMYFRRNSSLSAFYKIGVLKTSARFLEDHIQWSLFSIKLLTFSVGDCFWYLERISNIWYLILNKFFYSINIVGTVTFDE